MTIVNKQHPDRICHFIFTFYGFFFNIFFLSHLICYWNKMCHFTANYCTFTKKKSRTMQCITTTACRQWKVKQEYTLQCIKSKCGQNISYFSSYIKVPHEKMLLCDHIQLSPLLECDLTVCLPEKSMVTPGLARG